MLKCFMVLDLISAVNLRDRICLLVENLDSKRSFEDDME